MSTNEHNPDGLPEMKEFRFLCIGETLEAGDEFWHRGIKQWFRTAYGPGVQSYAIHPDDFTYRRRVTPPADRKPGTPETLKGPTPICDAHREFRPDDNGYDSWVNSIVAEQLERRLMAALAELDSRKGLPSPIDSAESKLAQLTAEVEGLRDKIYEACSDLERSAEPFDRACAILRGLAPEVILTGEKAEEAARAARGEEG